jgi:Zn ribbon nucleic-acid-binding protein
MTIKRLALFFGLLALVVGIVWLVFDKPSLEPVTFVLGGITALFGGADRVRVNRKLGLFVILIGLGVFAWGMIRAFRTTEPIAPTPEFSNLVESWTEWIGKIPIPVRIIFGAVMLLWIAVVLVRKRLKTIRESEIDYTPYGWNPLDGWNEVGELEHAGVLWTVRASPPDPWETFDPMSVSTSKLSIATPPKCPKCRTELEEKLRFFGGYKWECIRCGFKKRNKDDYYRESQRALKLAKSDWEVRRRSGYKNSPKNK